MRIMDWSSDVCSSDLRELRRSDTCARPCGTSSPGVAGSPGIEHRKIFGKAQPAQSKTPGARPGVLKTGGAEGNRTPDRSEEHTSELQSLMRISYAVLCLKKKTKYNTKQYTRSIIEINMYVIHETIKQT